MKPKNNSEHDRLCLSCSFCFRGYVLCRWVSVLCVFYIMNAIATLTIIQHIEALPRITGIWLLNVLVAIYASRAIIKIHMMSKITNSIIILSPLTYSG